MPLKHPGVQMDPADVSVCAVSGVLGSLVCASVWAVFFWVAFAILKQQQSLQQILLLYVLLIIIITRLMQSLSKVIG